MQKKIISVSRRTDIPAFYTEWFISRVRAGTSVVANPLYPEKSSRVSLLPEDVLAFVFCTRDPSPLMPYLAELDRRGFTYYFQVTLIGYPRLLDPRCPELGRSVENFRKLSSLVGRERVVWRYDPIVFSNITSEAWHRERIAFLCGKLRGYTEKMMISFIDPYLKTKRRLASEPGPAFALSPKAFDPASYRSIASYIGMMARKHGITAHTCAEECDLSEEGIEHGKCIDAELVSRLARSAVPPKGKKNSSQRPFCGCSQSVDIGAYDTCLFGCSYCYATSSILSAERNFREHDPRSECITADGRKGK